MQHAAFDRNSYAIVNDMSAHRSDFFKRHEGVQVRQRIPTAARCLLGACRLSLHVVGRMLHVGSTGPSKRGSARSGSRAQPKGESRSGAAHSHFGAASFTAAQCAGPLHVGCTLHVPVCAAVHAVCRQSLGVAYVEYAR